MALQPYQGDWVFLIAIAIGLTAFLLIKENSNKKKSKL